MADKPITTSVAHGLAGVVILIAVIVLWIQLQGNPALQVPRGRDPGPAFQPRLLLILLGACALWLTASSFFNVLVATSRHRLSSAALHTLRSMVPPLAMIVALIAFVILAPRVGFLPVSLVFTLGWALWLAWREGPVGRIGRMAIAAAGATAITLGIYWVFARVIGVPL